MAVTLIMLSYDHGFIRQIIDILGKSTKEQTLEKLRTQMVEIIDFLWEFMDEFHHGKEERFLFPSITNFAPIMISDIQKLISDHQHARDLLKLMDEEIKKEGDLVKFHEVSSILADHMTNHIKKEEEIIFPLTKKYLTDEEDRRIYLQFEKFTITLFYKFTEKFANRIQNKVLNRFYENTV